MESVFTPEPLRRSPLKLENIRYNDYFRSLSAELIRQEQLCQEEIEYLRAQLFDALGALIRIYTREESSSLITDTANDLLRSLLFNVDCYLIGLGDHERAAHEMLSVPVMDLYYRGIARVRRLKCECASLLAKARHTAIPLPNVYYRELLDIQLMEALKTYDERFHAHLISGDIDYPLAVQSNTLRGIHYLRGYLMDLCRENAFCQEYDPAELKELYLVFCEQNRFPRGEPRVNLYTTAFLNALLCEYLRKDPGSLLLTEDECDIIEVLLGDMEREERADILRQNVGRMLGGDPAYNLRTLEKALPCLQSAIEFHKLKNHVVCVL